MKKLALRIEDLAVTAFATGEGAGRVSRGTVHGHFTGLSRYSEYATCTQPTDPVACGTLLETCGGGGVGSACP